METVQNYFWEQGCIGIQDIAATECIAYWSGHFNIHSLLAGLQHAPFRTEATWQLDKIENSGWESNWQRYFHPVEIGRNFIVHPPWEKPVSYERIPVEIMPGQAFGTGSHESTSLVIELMECLDMNQLSVLDVGCGSGILGICAKKLNAQSVIGIDIDGNAVREAVQNARNNQEKSIQWIHGTIDALKSDLFDLILANILRPALMDIADKLAKVSRQNATIILSGLLYQDMDPIEKRYAEAGYALKKRKRNNEWIAGVFERNDC